MWVVVTADQRRSRRGTDLVPATLDQLSAATPSGTGLRFERTAGDEVQGLLREPREVVDVLAVLLRGSAWSVGLGVGPVDTPLPASTRAGRGNAFVLARQAVEAAKRRPGHVAVAASDPAAGERLETVLMLWADVLARRTTGGWQVVDLLEEGLTRAETADRLGISLSAVSQRVTTAGLVLSERAGTLTGDLLTSMLAEED